MILSADFSLKEDIESIAIFGSVARGDAKRGSDIDVLILAKNSVEIMEEELSAVVVGERPGKVFMAKIFTPKDFEASLRKGSKFAKEVLKDLTIIYDPNNFLQKLKNEFARHAS